MKEERLLRTMTEIDAQLIQAHDPALAKRSAAPREHRPLRIVLIAAAVAALMGTAALALSPTLRDALQNALGRFAPYAQDMTQDKISCADQGIEVRVVSALNDGNTITIYFEAQDLTGDRLDEFTHTNTQLLWPTGQVKWKQGTLLTAEQIAYDKETKTALYRTGFIGDGIPAEKLTLSLDGQVFSPGFHKDPHEPLPDEVISKTDLRTETLADGSVVLAPRQNPTTLVEGCLTLSSCGFGEDGRFHILVEVKSGAEAVLNPSVHTKSYLSGEETDGLPNGYPMKQEVRFDRDGMTYYDFTCKADFPYQPARADLDELVIDQLFLHVREKEKIEGEWKLEVPLENQSTTTVPMAQSGTEEAIGPRATKLFLSPISCTVECNTQDGAGTLGYPLALFHADGRVTSGIKCDSSYYGKGYATNHWTFDRPIDPESVTAIAIGQWYVPIENGIAQPGHWLAEAP